MRVLFDQGTPVPLRQSLNSHTVTTVYEKGWSRTRNGDLLRLAEQLFEVFITTDRQLKYQQNLTDHQIAIVVLPTTSWPGIQRHADKIVAVLDSIKPGELSKLLFDTRPAPLVQSWRELRFNSRRDRLDQLSLYRDNGEVAADMTLELFTDVVLNCDVPKHRLKRRISSSLSIATSRRMGRKGTPSKSSTPWERLSPLRPFPPPRLNRYAKTKSSARAP